MGSNPETSGNYLNILAPCYKKNNFTQKQSNDRAAEHDQNDQPFFFFFFFFGIFLFICHYLTPFIIHTYYKKYRHLQNKSLLTILTLLTLLKLLTRLTLQ